MRKKNKREIKYRKLKTAKKITFSMEECHYMCHYCENYFDENDLTLDHKIPKANNGATNMENLELSCEKCNFVKGKIFYNTFMNLIKRIGLENYKNMINNL